MKMPTLAEVIAIVALLVAVYVGVRYWNMETESHYRMAEIAQSLTSTNWMLKNSPTAPRFVEIETRLAEIETRLENVENGFIAATAHLSAEPWPEVIRTTSGDRPEVRAIEEGKP